MCSKVISVKHPHPWFIPRCSGGAFVFMCRDATVAETSDCCAVDVGHTYTRFTFSQTPWRSHYNPAELNPCTMSYHSALGTAVV